MMPKSEEHKKRIADSVRSKWADPEFRRVTSEKMRAAAHARIIAMGGVPKPRREKRPPRMPGVPRAPRLAGRTIPRTAATSMAKWEKVSRKTEVSLHFMA